MAKNEKVVFYFKLNDVQKKKHVQYFLCTANNNNIITMSAELVTL